jgi:hypothetical protein
LKANFGVGLSNREVFRGRTLFVGCSGNFTIEQLLGEYAGAVHSNDISIYSHFVGHHLTGQRVRWAIRDSAWAWLQPYCERNLAATVVMLFELLKLKPESNLYNRRVYGQLLSAWEDNFPRTCENLERAQASAHITSYRSSDIWDFVDEARTLDPGGIFLAFLPFYKGGYERLYRKLAEILDWDPPRYEIIDAARKAQLITKIQSFDYVTIDDVFYPEAPAVMLKQKTTSKQMWLYSNLPVEHLLVQQHTRSKASYYPLLTEAGVALVTPRSKVTIKRVAADEFNYFRNRYLAKTIQFTNGVWPFLFFIDEQLFGFVIGNVDQYGGYGLYILSDFTLPIPGSRISKLLVLLLQSTHFRDVVQELLMRPVPDLDTTAFTDHPVSMKYRGAWELTKRGVSNGKKFLTYHTLTGIHSDREAITKWMKSRKNSKS